jgi:hypothetical protein
MKRGYAALFEFILKEYYNPPEADKRSRWDFLRSHQLKRQSLRLLGCMRMLITGINFQLFEKLSAESVLGQHTLDGKPDKILRSLFHEFLGGDHFEPSDVTAVPVVNLLLPFSACQDNLIRIDNNNPVTRINMRCKKRVVFSSKACSYV